jgi:hypothetical protein
MVLVLTLLAVLAELLMIGGGATAEADGVILVYALLQFLDLVLQLCNALAYMYRMLTVHFDPRVSGWADIVNT